MTNPYSLFKVNVGYGLESQFHPQLDDPVITFGKNLSERRIKNASIGCTPILMIEDAKEFSPDAKPNSLSESKRSLDRHVPVLRSWTDNHVPAGIAKAIGCLQLETTGIKELLQRWVGKLAVTNTVRSYNRQIVHIRLRGRHRRIKWFSRTKLCNPAELPISQDLARRPMAKEALVGSER